MVPSTSPALLLDISIEQEPTQRPIEAYELRDRGQGPSQPASEESPGLSSSLTAGGNTSSRRPELRIFQENQKSRFSLTFLDLLMLATSSNVFKTLSR